MLKLTEKGKILATAKTSKDLKRLVEEMLTENVEWIFNYHNQVLEGLASLLHKGPDWHDVREVKYRIEHVR